MRNKIFRDIYENNTWGSDETKSGVGSELKYTIEIRKELSLLFKELKTESLLDIPCGDVNWIQSMDLHGIRYVGCDIVPEAISRCRRLMPCASFFVADIVSDELPMCDTILCRDCLVHLCDGDAVMAIENMKKSGALYLVATTFPHIRNNSDCRTGGWRPINLELFPFNMGKPVRIIDEGGFWTDKSLGVWKI